MSLSLQKLKQDLVMVLVDGVRRVGMLKDAYKDFISLDAKTKGKMAHHFHHFGIQGTTLPKEHFNSEGRHPTGGNKSRDILVQAFKSFQTRLYGIVMPYEGIPTFVGSRLITDKKRNKADQNLLRRVAQDFRQYLED